VPITGEMEPTRIRVTPALVAMFTVGMVVAATALEAGAIVQELIAHPNGALVLSLVVYLAVFVASGWLLGRLARRLP